MKKIELKDFELWQPSFPLKAATNIYYLNVANRLFEIWEAGKIFKELPEELIRRCAIGLTGYFQDIVSDTGIWRSFSEACLKMYGERVPFHPISDHYIEYELNREDVRFLTWYLIAMNYEDLRFVYPLDSRILALAERWADYLESIYDDAPEPEGWNIVRGLELHDPEDSDTLLHLSRWLSMHCYLMTPAFSLTLAEILNDPEIRKDKDYILLQKRLEEAMTQDPTGPLAFFIPEWLCLIVKGEMPKQPKSAEGNHPYYEKFTKATGGSEVAYFGSYAELNRFLIEKMGWEKDQDHLPMVKEERDFVAMVNPHKGMLVARNVARCIADPQNPYYEAAYARENAIRMLTERGFCPCDLTKYCFSHGFVPDAVYGGSDDTGLVKKYWDFIARCYLQLYYRD